METQYKKLILRGKAIAFIDWANVYGWEKSLKREINIEKLFHYLKNYSEIADARFYFGEDDHPKSRAFLESAKNIGYTVISKPVKNILIAEIENQKIYRRKCDFDMEACIDVHAILTKNKDVESLIFLTGDGDYEPLYKMLIKLGKQVIVVYTQGHLGREIWDMKYGIFKVELKNLMEL